MAAHVEAHLMTREEMGKLVFAQVFPHEPWSYTSDAVRERCMLAAEAVDRASRRDERAAIVKMLRAEAGPGAELSESYGIVFLDSESPSYAGLCMAADMVEARNTEGVE
jgi:hypothetical protein